MAVCCSWANDFIALDETFLRWSTNKAPRYSQKASVRHFEFEKFRFFSSNFHARNGNLHPYTKLDRNRIIRDWDMEIKLFSKWRPSAILNFRKLQFWSRVLYWHVSSIGIAVPRYTYVCKLATPTRTWLGGRDAIVLYLEQQQQQRWSAVRNHTHLNSRDDK